MTKLRTMLVVVICAMAVLLTGSVAMAKDSNDTVISKVSSLGIMVGTNKGFEETKTLTRAEATAIIVRMAGYEEKEIDKYVGETNFSDVKENYWGAKYINVATSQNLVKGIGKGLFAPDREVTVAEFVTMAVRSLGAEAYVEPLGQWPANYMSFAKDEDIVGSKVNGNVTATRMDAANIVANTLEAKMWKKVSMKTTGEVEYTQGTKTLLEEVFEVEKLENVKVGTIDRVKETIKLGNKKYDYDLNLGLLVADAKVDAWVKDEKVIRIEIVDDYDYIVFDGFVKKEKDEATFMVNGEEATFDCDKNAKFNYSITTSGVLRIKDDKIVDVKAVKDFSVKEVKRVVAGKRLSLDDVTINLDDDKILVQIYDINGKEIDAEDLSKEDKVLYNVDNNVYTIKLLETLTGKVTSYGKDYVKIDGVKYETSDVSLKAYKKVTVCLYNGRIVSNKEAKTEVEFAYIVDKETLTNDKDYKAIYEVVLAGADDTIELYYAKTDNLEGFYAFDIEDEEIIRERSIAPSVVEGEVYDFDGDEITITVKKEDKTTENVEFDLDDDCIIFEDDEVTDVLPDYFDKVTLYILNNKVICIKY